MVATFQAVQGRVRASVLGPPACTRFSRSAKIVSLSMAPRGKQEAHSGWHAEATVSSLPKESARHGPCPTPVGEESYGEKAGAALVSFWVTRMLLFNSILHALLSTHDNEGSHTYTWQVPREGVGMKTRAWGKCRKKRWQELWLVLRIRTKYPPEN